MSGPPPLLMDEFIESYVCWREECEQVHSAYERWGRSEPADRSLAFAVYRAALEREERAAGDHLDWTKRLRARGFGLRATK